MKVELICSIFLISQPSSVCFSCADDYVALVEQWSAWLKYRFTVLNGIHSIV